jgi:tubulin-specific chaperone A
MKEGTKQLNEYNAAKKKKADLERAEEATEKRNSRASNFGASKNDGKPKKETENRRKEAEKNKQDLEKELNDSQDSYEKANDDILAAENKLADEKLKIQSESINKEIAQQNQFHKEELEKLEQNNQKILDKILELEKKKLEAKNPLAKVNYQNAIDQEKKLLEINNSIKEQTEHTHQFKIKTIREKATAKKFEDDAKFIQRQIENRRRDREQEITNISSLEQAKEKLRNQSYLKLTDDEHRAIDNLEDAKAALREVYDREMLANQEKAISLQIAQLNEALNDKSLSDDARQKLAENLDFLKDKITQVRAAIKGGEEADAKKVSEENKQKKGSIDILGFSAQDWEETFDNLNTTAKKVKAIGMVFTAMSNAASMFSEAQRNLGERDLCL